MVENEGIILDFSRQKMTADTLSHLAELAREKNLSGAVESMFNGVSEDTAFYAVVIPVGNHQQVGAKVGSTHRAEGPEGTDFAGQRERC